MGLRGLSFGLVALFLRQEMASAVHAGKPNSYEAIERDRLDRILRVRGYFGFGKERYILVSASVDSKDLSLMQHKDRKSLRNSYTRRMAYGDEAFFVICQVSGRPWANFAAPHWNLGDIKNSAIEGFWQG